MKKKKLAEEVVVEDVPARAIAEGDDTPLLIGDYDPERVELWIDYLYGAWTKNSPELPGWYAVATLDGDFVGYREYIMVGGKIIDPRRAVNEPGWQGWFWTAALPAPPKGTPE
jgi:hypothetical protein